MMLHGVLAKAAATVVTGAVGVGAYEALRKAVAKAPIREASVTAAAWALRGTRKAEETAEVARLKIADVMAEARERVGEEVAPPAVVDAEHRHD
jgi:lysozyme family protein